MSRGPRARGHSVTIGDVARVAGVSRATASRALNDSPQVTQSTREKVLAAVRETGFVMNSQGRALALGRTEAIAILFTEPLKEMFSDPTYATIVQGISDTLSSSSTMPVLLQASTEFERARALRRLQHRVVDAVIALTPYIGEDLLRPLADGPLPLVVCGQPTGDRLPNVSHVYSDDVAGARAAAHHLVTHGRRTIAILNGPLSNPAARDRLTGYRAALGELFRPDLVSSGGWDVVSGAQRTAALLDAHPEVDGILAASDRIAAGAVGVLRSRSVPVPDRVAIVGFDDSPAAVESAPALTTIRQPLQEQGSRAAQVALEMIDGAGAIDVQLDNHLVIRASA